MPGKNQHVVRRPHGWAVRGEGNSQDTSHHDTQAQAIARAREIAQHQNSEVVIHGRDGRIRDKDSYDNDPLPTLKTKLTSQVSPELLAELRTIANEEGRPFQAVLEDAMRGYIESRAQEKPRTSVMAHFKASVEKNRRLGELLAQ